MKDIERTLLFGSNLPHLRCSFFEYSPSFPEKIFITALPGWGVGRIFICRRSSDVNDCLSEFQKLIRLKRRRSKLHLTGLNAQKRQLDHEA